MIRIAVIGPRHCTNLDFVRKQLDRLLANVQRPIILTQGLHNGPGRNSEWWAYFRMRSEEKFGELGKRLKVFKANWEKYPVEAARIRDKVMLRETDYLIAFHDGVSKTVQYTIDLATDRGIKVSIIRILPK